MAILVATPANGVRVLKNATHLTDSPTLAAGAVAVSLDDDSVIAQNDYGVIEGETVQFTDVGETSPRTIVRAQNDHNAVVTVDTDHDAGAFVRKQGGGHELLTYAFTDTDFAGFKVRSERAFWWALEIDGAIAKSGYCKSDVPFYTDVQPVETIVSATYVLHVWWQAPASEARTGQVFWGEIFN